MSLGELAATSFGPHCVFHYLGVLQGVREVLTGRTLGPQCRLALFQRYFNAFSGDRFVWHCWGAKFIRYEFPRTFG
jgi:hypothetical protein